MASSPKPRRPLRVEVDALTEGAMVEGDAGVVGREVGHLLPPAQVVAALAVGEEDGGA